MIYFFTRINAVDGIHKVLNTPGSGKMVFHTLHRFLSSVIS